MSWNNNNNDNGWSRPTWRPRNNNQYNNNNNNHNYNNRYPSNNNNNNYYGHYGNRNRDTSQSNNGNYGHYGNMNRDLNQYHSNNNSNKKRDYWGRDDRKQKSIKPDPSSAASSSSVKREDSNNTPSTFASTNRNNNNVSNNNDNRNNSNNDDEILAWRNAKTHDQKIRLLLPRIQGRGPPGNWVPDLTFYNNIPIKILQNKFDKDKMKKKSEDAVKAAIAAVEKFYKDAAEENTFQASKKAKREEFDSDQYFSSDDDSFDDDPMYGGGGGGGASHKKQNNSSADSYRWNGASLDEVKTFVRNLPMHLLFTASFEATGSRAEEKKLCHCPCSTRYSSQWQRLAASNSFQVLQNCRQEEGCNNLFDSCNGKLFQDFALVAHLRQLQKNDPFHHGILVYVETYYSNYIGTLPHGAITQNVNDKLYKKFEQYRIHDYECRVEKLLQERENWRSEHDKIMKRTKDQQEIIDSNRKIFDNLGLKEGDLIRSLSKNETDKYMIHFEKFIDMAKKANNIKAFDYEDENKKSISRRKDILLTKPIPQDFKLNEQFQKWKEEEFPLFTEFDKKSKDALKLLNRAEWNFAHYAKDKDDSDEEGIDHGGLTRVFLDKAFEQMKDLYIEVPSEAISSEVITKIKLFDVEEHGIQPKQDEVLKHEITRALNNCADNILKSKGKKIIEKWKKNATNIALRNSEDYYRAFGRLMVHSVANKNNLPHNILPGLYRAYLFCGKTPKDEDYVKAELFQHVREMNFPLEGIKDLKDVKSIMDEILVESRTGALEAILRGLTLDGRIDFRTCFFASSVEVVDKLLFSSPVITAEEILKNLKYSVVYSETLTHYDQLTSIQEEFKAVTFPTFLRRKEVEEPEFLKLFLKLVTGLPFINRGNPTIGVCFTNLSDGYDGALPASHTCEQEIDFPLNAYNAKLEVLDEKLSTAVLNAVSQITMN